MKHLYALALFLTFYSFHGQTFVKDFYSINELVSIGDQAFFVATDGTHGKELWTSDGTSQNTFLIKDINTLNGSEPASLFVFNDTVYFSANDELAGNELWKTDGTPGGTVMVKDIHTAFNVGSWPSNFTVYNNELYFTASDNYNGSKQLWKTDGTAAGTVKIYDAGDINISQLVAANNKLYFILNYGPNRLMAYEANAGVNEVPTDSFYSIKILDAFNDDLYYLTFTTNNQNIRINKLGDAGATNILIEYIEPQYSDYEVFNFTQVGNEVYFSLTSDLDSGETTDQLWKTDGTSSGTVLIKTFNWNRYLAYSNISNFIEYQGQLFFNGGSQNNYSIWKSDGTSAGTVLAANTSVGRNVKFTELNDLLYYSSSQKLWSTDGTQGNTRMVSNILLSDQYSDDFFGVHATSSTIFFEAQYQNSKALFTTKISPLLEVKQNYTIFLNNSDLYIDSKIDSVAKRVFTVKNIGNKDLSFSNIKVTGEDFYIKGRLPVNITPENPEGNVPQILNPNQQAQFEVSFFPSTAGMKTGTLRILSDDIKTPSFEVNLVAMALNEVGETVVQDISTIKEIDFANTEGLITLDHNTVAENAAVNTDVGVLSIPNSSDLFTFELNLANGNTDNQFFTVEDDVLKTNAIFNFEVKNTYTLAIKATNTVTNEVIEDTVIITLTNVSEAPVLAECSIDMKDLAYGLNDVEFITDQQVVAVGSHGVILKSDNGGTSWRKVRSDYYNNLYNVQFTSSTIGYAIGENILKTLDGGEHWFTLKLPDESYPFPSNIYFIDSDTGFVFGQEGKVFKTTNGGRYWHEQTFGFETLNAAFFINPNKGFIIGNSQSVFRTENAGNSWQNIDIGVEGLYYAAQFTAIYFVNDTLGYIATNRGDIIQTADGGDTWTLFTELEYDINITRLIFENESIGFALTEEYIYKTLDGGQTWSRDITEYVYSGLQGIAANADGSKRLIVGHGTSCCTGFSTGHIIYSKTLDNEWQLTSYLTLSSYDLTALVYTEDFKIVFSDNMVARSYGDSEIWTRLTLPEDTIRQVELRNGTLYVLGLYNFYKSVDQGDTWITLGAATNFVKFWMFSDQNIMAITYGSGVFRSTDGGVTWLNVSSAPSFGLDIQFKNENEGYAATVNTGLYKTLDGGNTWSQVPMDTDGGPMSAYSVHVINNLGFAGSASGLLKSTDGGSTWQRAYKNVSNNIRAIHAINEQQWYAITDSQVFKSMDSGDSWTLVFTNSYDIYDSYFVDDRVYLAGYKTFVEIAPKDTPEITNPIEGDVYVTTNSTTEYSVTNHIDTEYNWSVMGNNDITYSRNKAEIHWNIPGTYQVTVTPLNNCGNGTITNLTVTVADDDYTPNITGDDHVSAFSSNNSYSATYNDSVRYHWSVTGEQAFTANGGDVSVDWGAPGFGKVHVITTHETFGTRKEAFLDVTILPTTISSDNFDIQVIGETCPGLDNGKIIITATEEHQYQVTVNNTTHTFTNTITIDDLAPHTYNVCITIPASVYEQCYVLELQDAESISGRYSVDSDRLSIDIDSGTAPFKVMVNEELVLETSATSFSIDTQHGDVIEVKSNKPCEGSLLKTIDLYQHVVMYPNPAHSDFQIAIPFRLETVSVAIYTSQFKLMSSRSYQVIDGNIQLNIEDQPNGLYFIRVDLDTPLMLKLIKL